MSFSPDAARLGDSQRVGVEAGAGDGVRWKCHTTVAKYRVDDFHAGRDPYEVHEEEGNLLMIGGADVMWLGITNGMSGTSGLKNTYFTRTLGAALLIGDTNTAAASSQTDLLASSGATHRWVQGVDSGFPTHTTGTAASTSTKILFKATVSSANANFAWAEWGVGNKVSQAKAYPGRLLNRKVQSLGTKTSAGVWALTVTLSLA